MFVILGISKCHVIDDLEYANYKTLEYKRVYVMHITTISTMLKLCLDSVKIEDSPYIEAIKVLNILIVLKLLRFTGSRGELR